MRANLYSIITAVLLFVTAVAVAQPANDDCATATPFGTLVAGTQSCKPGTNVLATPGVPYSNQTGCQPAGNMANPALDVWYTVTLPAGANQLHVKITGALPSINVALYSGTCGALVPEGCAISNSSNMNYTFGPGLVAGTTYYVQVSGNSAVAAGAYNLCLTALVPPVNDSCAHASAFGTLVNTTQSCKNGTTTNASPEFPYTSQTGCIPNGNMATPANDVWYTVTTPAGANELQVTINSTMNTLNVGIYTGGCGALNPVACAIATSGNFSHLYQAPLITQNTTYYIQVSGGSVTDTGSFSICLKSYIQPTNDPCITAQNVGTLVTGAQLCTPGTNVGANPEFPFSHQYGCSPNGGTPSAASDVWYQFTVPAGTNLQMLMGVTGSTLGTTSVSLYSGGCGSLQGAGCVRTSSAAYSDTFPVLPGGTYYVQVSGANQTDVGNFNLCLKVIVNPSHCVGGANLVATPPPTNGTYPPGTTVQWCYTETDFTQLSANWFHGLELLPGPGWDMTSLSVISIPASCDGSGNWGFYNSCTSSATGVTKGPGFYYDSSLGGPLDGNPGNNFGDDCATHVWTFCWELTTLSSSSPVDPCLPANSSYTDARMGVRTYGDGQTGSWSSFACYGDLPTNTSQIISCCPQPLISKHNPSCPNSANGSIVATGQGNAGNTFSYAWNTGANTDSIGNLPPGTYTVTVTNDTTLCIAITTVILTGGNDTLNVDSVDIACFGQTNGKAFAYMTGTAGTFSYVWNTVPPQTGDTIFNLAAGTYIVTVTLPGGCTLTDSTIVNSPSAMQVYNLSQTDVTCFGASNGSAEVDPYFGTPFPPPAAPYTYLWSDGETTNPATALPGGTATVTTTDAHGCTFVNTFTIGQPAAINATIVNDSVKCNGGNTGSAWLVFSGGQPPYTYTWNTNPVQSTDTAINLTAGTYNASVTDANGCQFPSTTIVGEPPLLVLNVSHTDELCNGASTAFGVATVSGGTPLYTYAWGTTPTQSTDTAHNLSAGTFDVTVTDSKGCSLTNSVTIAEPTLLTTTVGADSAKCFASLDGRVWVTAAGGTPTYTVNWGTTPVQTTDTASGLGAGPYSVIVTDNNGCTATNSIAVGEPLIISLVLDNDSVKCFNGNDGKAWVTASGGSGLYTYAWSTVPSQITDTAFNLIAGSYTVSVTDAHQCQQSDFVNVFQPASMLATAVIDSVNCFGGSDGSITLTVVGGAAPYTFVWNNGALTQNISGVPIGTYDVTITDFNNCTYSLTGLQVFQPAVLASTIFADSVQCFGGNTGKAYVHVTGGTPLYSYNWSPGPSVNSDTFRNLAVGIYNVTISDKYGCSATNTIQIYQPTALATTVGGDSVKCFGGGDGKAFVTASGGVLPYTYNWSSVPVQHTDTAFNLIAGLYKVTTTDGNGCFIKDTIRISQPTPLAIVMGKDSVKCFGTNTGKVWVTTTGGIQPYSYAWNGGPPNSDTTNNVIAGTYSVVVTDFNGCTITGSATIGQPPSMQLQDQVDSVRCNGTSTGRITLTIVIGGNQPYTYSWSDGQTTRRDDNIAAGIYSVTVTDRKGCRDSIMNIFVYQPAPLVVSLVSVDSVKCNGDHNGKINLTTTGGTQPYYYLWTNNAPGVEDPYGLGAGTYTVDVTDKYFCATTITETVGEPPLLTVSNTIDSIKCHSGTGNINLTVGGGSQAYAYAWSNGATSQNNMGVTAGGYTATVTDAHGCENITNYILDQPDSITEKLTVQYPHNCPFPLVSVPISDSVGGGTLPYTYLWSDNTTASSTTVTAYGTYSITVTDAHNCTHTSSVTIVQPDSLTLSVVPSGAVCFGDSTGSAQANATGGFGGYIFIWNASDTTAGSIHNNLQGGTYTVTVVDRQGCKKDTTFTIAERPEVKVSIDSTVMVEVGRDTVLSPAITGLAITDTVTYTWTPTTNLSCSNCLKPTVSPLDSTLYHIVVNVNGCIISDSIWVLAGLKHIFYAPSAFSPNGDGKNDYYSFYGYGIRRLDFTIENRWGDVIFEGHDVNDIWDGTTRGEQAAAGVYVYSLYVEFADRYNFRKKGTITLIR